LKELREDLVKAKSLVKNERELSNGSCSDSNKGSDNTLHVQGTVGDAKPEKLKAIITTDCSESSKPVAETDKKERDDLEQKSDQNECGSGDSFKSVVEKVNESQSVRINKDNGKGKEAEEEEEEEEEEEVWSIQEKEKLLHFLSKVFLLNFPLYVAYKHSVQSKLEEISPQEAGNLNVFCDLHDPEIPVYLLRNVCLFCKSGGVHAMTFCFDRQSPETLPVSIAHAIIAIVCNLKLWLNFRSIMQLFVPLRSKVLRYMCNLSDKDLRMPGIKTMAGEK
jgi:ubiquitin carboxyl-terminal hydrolase 34